MHRSCLALHTSHVHPAEKVPALRQLSLNFTPGSAANSLFLTCLLAMRSKALEHAALPDVTPENRRKLLSFVVVRGGLGCRGNRLALKRWCCAGCPLLTTLPPRPWLLSPLQVGGGPTGVEVAAELYDLVKEDVARKFPSIAVRLPVVCMGICMGRSCACVQGHVHVQGQMRLCRFVGLPAGLRALGWHARV